MAGADFEWIDVHYSLIGKEFAHSERAVFFETVPTRLNDGIVNVCFSIFERDVADAFLVRKTGRGFKMVFQVAVHEREPAAEGIAEKGLAGPVLPHDGPMLVAGEIKGSVFENEAVPETEGGVGQQEKRGHS